MLERFFSVQLATDKIRTIIIICPSGIETHTQKKKKIAGSDNTDGERK